MRGWLAEVVESREARHRRPLDGLCFFSCSFLMLFWLLLFFFLMWCVIVLIIVFGWSLVPCLDGLWSVLACLFLMGSGWFYIICMHGFYIKTAHGFFIPLLERVLVLQHTTQTMCRCFVICCSHWSLERFFSILLCLGLAQIKPLETLSKSATAVPGCMLYVLAFALVIKYPTDAQSM